MVKIIGAGPGAKDLITVRGMRVLQEADGIIYAGSLVNEELLEYAKKECKKLKATAPAVKEKMEEKWKTTESKSSR